MQYSAPELYLGEPATNRSDIFSLGVIAYELLTGALALRRPRRRRAHPGRATPAALRPGGESNPGSRLRRRRLAALAIDPRRVCRAREFIFDLANPNPLAGPIPRPLLSRGSANVWRAIAAALALALLVSIVTRPTVPPRRSTRTRSPNDNDQADVTR